MPPEIAVPGASPAARETHARWCELSDLYDTLDECLAAAAWADAAALAPRLATLAAALAPSATATAAPGNPADAALEAATASITVMLAERQARALGVVVGARDTVAKEIARVHVTRGHAARYGADGARASLFSARVV